LASDEVVEDYQTYVVAMIKNETECVRSFYLVPQGGHDLAACEAGSFLFIRVEIDGRSQGRSYTITGSPGRYYRITVKRQAEGKVHLSLGFP
jgi:ferredoxin-NADP reductase